MQKLKNPLNILELHSYNLKINASKNKHHDLGLY